MPLPAIYFAVIRRSIMQTNNAFVLREIFGKYLLIPTRFNEVGNEIISLNEIGSIIWKLASTGLQKEEIIKRIDIMYCLENGSVEESAVDAFIDTLCEKSLLYNKEA